MLANKIKFTEYDEILDYLKEVNLRYPLHTQYLDMPSNTEAFFVVVSKVDDTVKRVPFEMIAKSAIPMLFIEEQTRIKELKEILTEALDDYLDDLYQARTIEGSDQELFAMWTEMIDTRVACGWEFKGNITLGPFDASKETDLYQFESVMHLKFASDPTNSYAISSASPVFKMTDKEYRELAIEGKVPPLPKPKIKVPAHLQSRLREMSMSYLIINDYIEYPNEDKTTVVPVENQKPKLKETDHDTAEPTDDSEPDLVRSDSFEASPSGDLGERYRP
jgi:hypothetical protein